MAVLLAEVIFALFAVFGVYAAVRLLATAFFSGPSLGVVLEIREEMDVAEAHRQFVRAKDCFFSGGRVVVLIEGGLPSATLLYDYFFLWGADPYLIEEMYEEKEV